MKTSCELIQDLLPLYYDHVCSGESCRVVEEHLEECEACREVLNALKTDLLPTPEEVQPLLSVQIRWNKEKRKAFVKGLLIAVCVFLVLFAAKRVLMDWKCVPMGKEDLVVSDVFQTPDGMIFVFFNDLYDLNFCASSVKIGKDGSGYIECYRPILAKKETSLPNTPKKYAAGNGFYPDTFPLCASDENHTVAKMDRVYLGISGDPENSILVWETGMDVRQATEEEIERYGIAPPQSAAD